jgi:DNA-binding transcriptional MocR family regulator
MSTGISATLGAWSARPGPLHGRLAAALREAIERGELPDNSKLPAERALARMLSVSRSTVAASYRALARDGLVEGRRGSGTYVRFRSAVRRLPAATTPEVAHLLFGGRPVDSVIDLRLAVAQLPRAIFDDAVRSLHGSAALASDGYFPAGIPDLRTAIAAHLGAAGLPTEPEQVIVTSGAQQAIGLVASLLARRGDRVAVESATFPGAAASFEATGARIVTIPLDERGARVDRLRSAVEAEAVRLAYVIPSFQTPTGTVMPEARRRELAQLAGEYELPVIDDCTIADLWLERPPPAPVASFAPDAPIITVGSMSKLVWGGLRVGWVRAPRSLAAPLLRLKAAADLGTSAISQALAAELLPRADEVRALRRQELAESTTTLVELLERLLPTWRYAAPTGGLTLWVRLPAGNADEFAQLALRRGVQVLPGGAVSPLHEHDDCLRLPLLREPGELVEAMHRLADAWAAYQPEVEQEPSQELRVVV